MVYDEEWRSLESMGLPLYAVSSDRQVKNTGVLEYIYGRSRKNL